MSKYEQYRDAKQQIEQETDAEIRFGELLEQSGVDIASFMEQWQLNQHQFNIISHYLYGLTSELPLLPPALAAVLIASRQLPRAHVGA